MHWNSMTTTKKEKKTIAFYNEQAEKYINSLGAEEAVSFWDAEIKEFQEMISFGKVIDIGVGSGREAREFIKKGYDYIGVEPAVGLRQRLEKKFPTGVFIGDTLYDWHVLPHSCDGFWCSAMLFHISRENIDRALQQIKKIMKPGAIGFISLAEGSGEYFDADTGRYFYLYSQEEFSAILKRNGFVVEKQNIRKQDTHKSWLAVWINFFVRVQN